MKKIILNNIECVRSDYVLKIDPEFIGNHKTIREYVKETKLSKDGYRHSFLRKRDNKWKVATKKRANDELPTWLPLFLFFFFVPLF